MTQISRLLHDIEAETRLTRTWIGKDHLDTRVMKAIGMVRRDQFVPVEAQAYAFDNGPLPIGQGQTISQPFIVALMTDLLAPEDTHVVLEIGTGSGYQAAVLSLLVSHVYTCEIIPELADAASERLHQLGYQNVTVLQADGYYGWMDHAPYDGIIVTAAAPAIPDPLLAQLKPGGRLVIPIGMPYSYQELMLIEKTREGAIEPHTVLGVSFVPLTGDLGRHLGPDGHSAARPALDE
ncbi:MAG: protein-L-isoaspartate(D-aspartate) O-methyltransferase [Methylotetracoccus sp.]|jgi:protein-L-isoaspartate(D-aspartate) O-methyltransferase|nr:protein-L-isoaspartate(D-aspartate) O-methyltransferase [Methylotetracoccus sp.]